MAGKDTDYLIDYAKEHGFTVGEVIDYSDDIKNSTGFAFYRLERVLDELGKAVMVEFRRNN